MEIHIGDRVAEVELVSKEDNKGHLQYSDGRSQRKRAAHPQGEREKL